MGGERAALPTCPPPPLPPPYSSAATIDAARLDTTEPAAEPPVWSPSSLDELFVRYALREELEAELMLPSPVSDSRGVHEGLESPPRLEAR